MSLRIGDTAPNFQIDTTESTTSWRFLGSATFTRKALFRLSENSS